jgi:hypothetical protein
MLSIQRIYVICVLYIVTSILIFLEIGLIIPKLFLVYDVAYMKRQAKQMTQVRIGMSRDDIEKAIGRPNIVLYPGDRIKISRFGPAPMTPFKHDVLVYDTSGLCSWRLYIYLNAQDVVTTTVFTKT